MPTIKLTDEESDALVACIGGADFALDRTGLLTGIASRLERQKIAGGQQELRVAQVNAVLDVLSPRTAVSPRRYGERIPIFEWGHETTPTDDEMAKLATEILDSVDRALDNEST